MRLIFCNVNPENGHIEITLREYDDADAPEYAIISHRWGNRADEVAFEDVANGPMERKGGYGKIVGCCAQALTEGLNHVWVDSCCIDRSSSAELSETINSMFRYYRDAKVCYAYLEDVSDGSEDPHLEGSSFRNSIWFTRGWTLQELIAPQKVVFFSENWTEIGTKGSLDDVVEQITGIDRIYLAGHSLAIASVAKRMSWAAKRTTTRIEDRAYSLMGIFDVHMPPIYGERENAFMRLQLEILKTSTDHTIFAWNRTDLAYSGMLAKDPRQFSEGALLYKTHVDIWAGRFGRPIWNSSARLDFEPTNFGPRIWLPIEKEANTELNFPVLRATLVCVHRSFPDKLIAIELRPLKPEGNQYVRFNRAGKAISFVESTPKYNTFQEIFVADFRRLSEIPKL